MNTTKISIIALLVLLVSLVGCKSDTTETPEQETETKTVEQQKLNISAASNVYKGEFIHVDSAAVLKGNNFIYGVKMDDITKQLISKVNSVKTDEYDVINVIVKGELTKNTEDGWEEIITITSIEKVFLPNQTQEENVIRYSSQKSE